MRMVFSKNTSKVNTSPLKEVWFQEKPESFINTISFTNRFV